jgi:SAM-dependent methyltransferase
VRFGDLRRLAPINDSFGYGRGRVIDRYYIDDFLGRYADDIHGRVLEIGDDRYTRKFGGNKVTKSDVLHYTGGNPRATVVADLTQADAVPSNTFDCIIITQTLQMICDVRAALRHLHRILRPRGALLATSHGTSKVCRFLGVDPWGEYWRFTSQSSRVLFQEIFGSGSVTVTPYGNVLTAMAFLHGLAVEDLKPHELNHRDPAFEVLIGVRAVKSDRSN